MNTFFIIISCLITIIILKLGLDIKYKEMKKLNDRGTEEIRKIATSPDPFSPDKRELAQLLSPAHMGSCFRILYAARFWPGRCPNNRAKANPPYWNPMAMADVNAESAAAVPSHGHGRRQRRVRSSSPKQRLFTMDYTHAETARLSKKS